MRIFNFRILQKLIIHRQRSCYLPFVFQLQCYNSNNSRWSTFHAVTDVESFFFILGLLRWRSEVSLYQIHLLRYTRQLLPLLFSVTASISSLLPRLVNESEDVCGLCMCSLSTALKPGAEVHPGIYYNGYNNNIGYNGDYRSENWFPWLFLEDNRRLLETSFINTWQSQLLFLRCSQHRYHCCNFAVTWVKDFTRGTLQGLTYLSPYCLWAHQISFGFNKCWKIACSSLDSCFFLPKMSKRNPN